jgi:hypothetical protein
MLPCNEVTKLHGELPSKLPMYKSNFDEVHLVVDNEEIIYWTTTKLLKVNKLLSSELDKVDKDYPDTNIYACDSNSLVQVDDTDVLIKYDVATNNIKFLELVINIAKIMNSVLVIEETGKVIQPSLANLRMNILRSRAYRFSTNPKQVLDEISQLHQSTNLNKKE